MTEKTPFSTGLKNPSGTEVGKNPPGGQFDSGVHGGRENSQGAFQASAGLDQSC